MCIQTPKQCLISWQVYLEPGNNKMENQSQSGLRKRRKDRLTKVSRKSVDLCVSYQCTLEKIVSKRGIQQQVRNMTHLSGVYQSQPTLCNDSKVRGRKGCHAWSNNMGFFSPRMIQLKAAKWLTCHWQNKLTFIQKWNKDNIHGTEITLEK